MPRVRSYAAIYLLAWRMHICTADKCGEKLHVVYLVEYTALCDASAAGVYEVVAGAQTERHMRKFGAS